MIRVIVTGGTFDKVYDALQGQLELKSSHIQEILEMVRCTQPFEVEVNQLTDSLYMTDEQRLSILEACSKATEEKIVIIHGTDTMTETAKLIGHANLKKTIVLTGALIPYSVKHTDAVFNLGAAFNSVQCLPNGVFICMNGKIFNWTNVQKNKELGIFENEA